MAVLAPSSEVRSPSLVYIYFCAPDNTFHDHAERGGEEGPDGQPGPGSGQGEEAGDGGHRELVRPQVVHTHRPRHLWTVGVQRLGLGRRRPHLGPSARCGHPRPAARSRGSGGSGPGCGPGGPPAAPPAVT